MFKLKNRHYKELYEFTFISLFRLEMYFFVYKYKLQM